LMLFAFIKFSQWFGKQPEIHVPLEDTSMAIEESGWLVGNYKCTTFYDWRDIRKILESTTAYGFQTSQNSTIFVPKRIFASPDDADEFIENAATAHRRVCGNSHENLPREDSDNPFQTPRT
ncbi:MAG: YcxB family protein, partial [Planctomycetota bacterium]